MYIKIKIIDNNPLNREYIPYLSKNTLYAPFNPCQISICVTIMEMNSTKLVIKWGIHER